MRYQKRFVWVFLFLASYLILISVQERRLTVSVRGDHTSQEALSASRFHGDSSFQVCTKHELWFPAHNLEPLEIGYECSGEKYNNFTGEMFRYIEYHQQTKQLWGRRSYPFPPNKTVLLIGNSHMRQIAYSLVCQFADKVVHRRVFAERGTEHEFSFANNSTLFLVQNSPYVYSNIWNELIEKALGIQLSDLDAVVLGRFNNYSPGGKNNFVDQMLQITKDMPDVDFKHVKPPDVSSLMKCYSGLIVAISMFSKLQLREFESSVRKSTQLQMEMNRSNVLYISGRKHIEQLGECGTDGPLPEDACFMENDQPPISNLPVNMHRCTGNRGGHPDLIAWDLIETLHHFLT